MSVMLVSREENENSGTLLSIQREEKGGQCHYLVSSRYHSKSGVGTADASHLSETCRPVAASLLLDSVMVGGSAGKKPWVISYAVSGVKKQ